MYLLVFEAIKTQQAQKMYLDRIKRVDCSNLAKEKFKFFDCVLSSLSFLKLF